MSVTSPGAEPTKMVTFVKMSPEWTPLPLVQGILVSYLHLKSITSIHEYGKLQWMTRVARIKVAPSPFAEGSIRLAFYGKQFFRFHEKADEECTISSQGSERAISPAKNDRSRSSTRKSPIDDIAGVTYTSEDIVCKVFKAQGRTALGLGTYERYRYMVDMEVQTIASYLAKQYNKAQPERRSNVGYEICYLKSKVLAIVSGDGKHKYYVVEKCLETEVDEWVKVINNAGAVIRGSSKAVDTTIFEYLTIFAHWTYCANDGYLIVTDLQGVTTSARVATAEELQEPGAKVKKTVLLTDPAIHCIASTRFGRTNLGRCGMRLFFETHDCNRFCAVLYLKIPNSGELDGVCAVDVLCDDLSFL